ncbi:MAG TPA: magnesium transporter CorA family protein [Streptosporangiaceae bacterium]|nr:magnesium transporter CorA family protein [Streptosporangiaceae bacterium]
MDGRLILLDGSTVPADAAAVKEALADGKLLWLDVVQPTPADVDMLSKTFSLHPLAAADLTEFGQRPKIEDFGNLVYMVWYGVAGDSAAPDATSGAGLADLTEVHCFVAEKFFVTVRHAGCHAVEQLHDNPAAPLAAEPGRPVRLILLHSLADRMIDSFFPPLSDLDDRIDELQEKIFSKPTNDQLAQLFAMQRWLVGARKLISPERDMVASLVSGMVVLPGTTAESDPYLRDLYDHLIRISDLVDSYRDLLSNAMDAYLSMVSNKLNEVMKQLTIIATVFLPLSFLTGFFGQNFAWLVGKLGSLGSFLILGIGTELIAVGGLYLLFRRRGWIGGG